MKRSRHRNKNRQQRERKLAAAKKRSKWMIAADERYKEITDDANRIDQAPGDTEIFGLPRRLVAGTFLTALPSEKAQRVGTELLIRHVLDRLPQIIDALISKKEST